jgi:hypothetical protein
MSTPNTGTCLSCQDSGLSITGNVIGILTLAYALAAGFYLYYNSFKNAKRELYDLENILEARYHEASHLESMLIPLTHTHTGGPHYQQVYRIQEASERSKDFLNEARELLYRLHSRRGAPSTRSRVFIAGRFIASKEKMVAMVGEAEKALVDLREAVNQVNSMYESLSHLPLKPLNINTLIGVHLIRTF